MMLVRSDWTFIKVVLLGCIGKFVNLKLIWNSKSRWFCWAALACWCSSSRFTKTSSLSSLASTSKCSGGDLDGGGDGDGGGDDDGGGNDDDGGDAEDASAEKVDDNWFQVLGFPPDHPRDASPHSLGRSQVMSMMTMMTMVMMTNISEMIIISCPNLSVFYHWMLWCVDHNQRYWWAKIISDLNLKFVFNLKFSGPCLLSLVRQVSQARLSAAQSGITTFSIAPSWWCWWPSSSWT